MYLAKYFMKQDPKRTIGRRLILANLLVRFGHLYLLVWGFPAKAVTFWDTFAKIMLAAMGQGVGCARAFWGRKYTRMVLGQGRKYTRMVLARVARVTASSVHAVRGLICTRGQGPRLYTRNGFAVCTPLFLQLCILCASMCAGCQVQVFSSLTAVYFVCSMCAGCQVHNNAFWTCVKYVPKQSTP